jgi:hypothetical protein
LPNIKITFDSPGDPLHYADWLTLVGFIPENEAMNMVKVQNVDSKTSSDEWLKLIRSAADETSKVTGRLSCEPSIKEIDPKYGERIAKLKSEQSFKQHGAGMIRTGFALVELAKLHVHQPRINMEYIESLKRRAPEPDDEEGTLKFCLPTQDENASAMKMITEFNPQTNTFSAITENLDLRILANTHSEDPTTHTPLAGFYYGFGLPQISVVEYMGMFLLKNGYHRAYTLLEKGHEFVPCVLSLTGSLQATGAISSSAFPSSLLFSDRSPILSDFRTPAAVPVPQRRLKLVATVHAEVQVVPM